MMLSPKERYENDAAYKALTDTIEGLLVGANFTPSEVRECAMLACIHYEMRYGLRHYQTVSIEVNTALETLRKYREKDEAAKKGDSEDDESEG